MLNKRQNNLLLITPSLDKQIEDIKQKIYLAMNGIVSEKMTQYGFFYKQNFGVSIPQLRNIAAQYNKNQDLAKRLWLLNIRETMIIATMIADESKLSAEDLRHWLSECSNMELIEQICMNLLASSSFSNQLAICLAQSENAHEKMLIIFQSACDKFGSIRKCSRKNGRLSTFGAHLQAIFGKRNRRISKHWH